MSAAVAHTVGAVGRNPARPSPLPYNPAVIFTLNQDTDLGRSGDVTLDFDINRLVGSVGAATAQEPSDEGQWLRQARDSG